MIKAQGPDAPQVELGPEAGTITIADEAAQVCGVIGCTESDQLFEVQSDQGVRVLCPEHVARWLSDD